VGEVEFSTAALTHLGGEVLQLFSQVVARFSLGA
jgi:hypothetical protein